MKITIAGSLGNIGKPLTESLVAAGHQVIVISSHSDRKADIEALGASAAIGSVSDAAFLTDAFTGADAVYTMTPPNLGGSNVIANTTAAGKSFAEAIQNADIKRVVVLSSIGADLPTGNGPIAGIHNVEQIYNQLDGVAVTYVRAGYFYINLFNDIPVIKGLNIIGANYPGDVLIPWVHPKDIAAAIADELQKTSQGKNVRYIVSDVRAAAEVASVIGKAIGKPELPWVEFTDDQSLQGMLGVGLPEEIAGLYNEMGTGFRTGIIPADYQKTGSPVTGKIKLEEFVKEFAEKFAN